MLVFDAWAYIFTHYKRYFGELTRGGDYTAWHAHNVHFCRVLRCVQAACPERCKALCTDACYTLSAEHAA